MRQGEIYTAIISKFPEVKEESGTGSIIIPKESLTKIARYLTGQPLSLDNLHCITAIDRKDKIEVVYIFYSICERHGLTLKVHLTYDDPNIASLTDIWRSANWLERETYDLMGVNFMGHPDLRRILNPYDWKGYPLRKDYSNPEFKAKPRL